MYQILPVILIFTRYSSMWSIENWTKCRISWTAVSIHVASLFKEIYWIIFNFELRTVKARQKLKFNHQNHGWYLVVSLSENNKTKIMWDSFSIRPQCLYQNYALNEFIRNVKKDCFRYDEVEIIRYWLYDECTGLGNL